MTFTKENPNSIAWRISQRFFKRAACWSLYIIQFNLKGMS